MAASRRFFVFLFIALILGVTGLLLSCGGGGGSGSSVGVTGNSGSGSVALMLADGPADDYQNIWMSVLEVILLPADGSALHPVTIFRSSDPEGYEFDLLDLRDQDFLLTVKDNIPSGTYSKIRLKINTDRIIAVPKDGIDAECGNNVGDLQIKLPSGKIDLNPRGGIPVRAGETLAIRLDIDANKSIQLHSAGNSGKCIFRPVVFVDIEPVFVPDRCPRIISGTIGNLDKEGGSTIGFQLLFPDEGQNPMDVWLIDTVIVDDDLTVGSPDDLNSGQVVHVRGRLDAEGDLQASLVIIGNVDRAKGTVLTPVDADNRFSIENFLIYPEPVTPDYDGALTIELIDGAVIYSGCDTPVPATFIQEGMGARMIGKFDPDTQSFRAVAVFVSPKIISGVISDYNLDMKTITLSPSGISVAVPDGVYPFLVGDGQIPWAYIRNRADCENGVQAEIYVDPEINEPTAVKILIPSESFTEDDVPAAVTDVYPIQGIIEANGRQIHVEEGATILYHDGDSDDPISLGELSKLNNASVRAYGLAPCPGGITENFFGFIVIAVTDTAQ